MSQTYAHLFRQVTNVISEVQPYPDAGPLTNRQIALVLMMALDVVTKAEDQEVSDQVDIFASNYPVLTALAARLDHEPDTADIQYIEQICPNYFS